MVHNAMRFVYCPLFQRVTVSQLKTSQIHDAEERHLLIMMVYIIYYPGYVNPHINPGIGEDLIQRGPLLL